MSHKQFHNEGEKANFAFEPHTEQNENAEQTKKNAVTEVVCNFICTGILMIWVYRYAYNNPDFENNDPICYVNKEQERCDEDDGCVFTATQLSCSPVKTADADFNATEFYMTQFYWLFWLLVATSATGLCKSLITLFCIALPICLICSKLFFFLFITIGPTIWYIDTMIWTHSIAGKVAGGFYLEDKSVFPNGSPNSNAYMIKSYKFLHTLLAVFNYYIFFWLLCGCLACLFVSKKKHSERKNRDETK
jgi:hypothetical protein